MGRQRVAPGASARTAGTAANRLNGLILAIAAAAVVSILLAHPVGAAAPSPSPSLDTVLAEPQSTGFVLETRYFAALQGSFDAVDYVAMLNSTKPSRTLTTLKADGFVSGYGRSWAERSSSHLLFQAVLAFSGGAGARKWLPEAQSLDQSSNYLDGNVSIPGIDLQFGDHFANPAGPAYEDTVGFVKGNDFFLVVAFSQKDDLTGLVTRQAQQLYNLAPANTIPPSQWPENAANAAAPTSLTALAPGAIVLVLAAVVAVVVVGLLAVILLRRGRPRPAPVLPTAGIQMSSDGYYWWDGQSWRDASQSAPPSAPRSADDNYWWDGGKWRQVPPTTPPASPPPVASAS